MALTRNYLRTHSDIRGRHIGAAGAGFDMFGWDRSGRRKNRSINWGGILQNNQGAVPYGNLHPSAWLMPQVSGGLAARLIVGQATVAAEMVQASQMVSTIAGTSTITAAGTRITGAIIGYMSANIEVSMAQPDLWSEPIEDGLLAKDAMRLIAASVAGKLSGAGSDTITIRNAVGDNKNRIVATVDPDGNRINISYDLSN